MTEDSMPAAEQILSTWSRAVLDSAMDAIVMIDDQGLVQYWNPAAADMFDRSWAEVAGLDMADLIIPLELRERHRHALGMSGVGAPNSILGRRIEVVGQRRDGSQFPVELTITRSDRGTSRLFTGYLRDITERRQLLADLQASRARLIEVSDRTRHRIERDLHDGAQQLLVGAAMAVTQARASLMSDPASAEALLQKTGTVLGDAIAEIRELARGVLPSVLADHGLKPALAELVRRSSIPVEVDTVPDRWPPTVETTLYFLAAEALTNAAKYGAQTAQLRLTIEDLPVQNHDLESERHDLAVVCTVGDDGPGGADPGDGTGLAGLQDRVAAVGGTLFIDSPPGGGTTITGRIPIRSARPLSL